MKYFSTYYKIVVFIALAILSIKTSAQQDPQFTQYMYNMSVINPAYATARVGVLNLGGLYRTQWVGIEGAPRTGTFFAHLPYSEKIEFGVSYINDQIGGIVNENNIYFDFAYVIPVSRKSSLSLGLKGGFTLFDRMFADDFSLQSGNVSTDNAFGNNFNTFFPNVGLGAFYYGKNYYVGLSAPNLLSVKHIADDIGVEATGIENTHYFLTGGYVFDVNDDIKFKPAFMLRTVLGAPLAADITANTLFYNTFEAGLAYRLGDAISALINFTVKPGLKIGYAYDYTTSNLSTFNSGTHEIFILYNIDLNGLGRSGYDRSPRFF